MWASYYRVSWPGVWTQGDEVATRKNEGIAFLQRTSKVKNKKRQDYFKSKIYNLMHF